MIPLAALALVIALMLVELVISTRNERMLLARGAIAPADPVYETMRWAYPGSFLAMAVEGALTGPASAEALAAGLAVFGFAKALKIWAISTLGTRWTFRVLVLPNAPLVVRGPYALLRHPNYVAVVGEIVGMALLVWALLAVFALATNLDPGPWPVAALCVLALYFLAIGLWRRRR